MPLLSMSGIGKSFPGVVALEDVSLTLEAGEIRALMGENGAGKSTLIKVLTGAYPSNCGSVALDGSIVAPRSPLHAQGLGISTVYQEVNLVPNLSVGENICLGREPRWLGAVRWKNLYRRAREATSRVGLDIDVTRPLRDCPLAIQQLVAIARAIDLEARVLVLDEPTSSLDKGEVEKLFDLMRSLKSKGIAILFVTHFIDQVYAVCDSITVLRNGRKVGDWPCSGLTRRELVAQMLGKELSETQHTHEETAAMREPMLSVTGLSKAKVIEPVSFQVCRGEVLGLAGLLGSGRTETMKLVFGAIRAEAGVVEVRQRARARLRRPRRPSDAVALGIGFCPEDRKSEGVFPGLSIAENLLVVTKARRGWWRQTSKSEAMKIVSAHVSKLGIKASDTSLPIDQLSGGNQQKVILSRWLAAEPTILMLDDPTRGIDVGAKLEVRRLIASLRAQGMSFLFSSSELDEVVDTSDRILVLRDRRIVGELVGSHTNETAVMDAIAHGAGD